MIKSKCETCQKEIVRNGNKPGRFCSKACMAVWQRSRKPVTREWLYQKYIEEGLGTTQIGRLVGRHPKRVYEWLVDWEIPTRDKHQGNASEPKPWRDKKLLYEMYNRPMTIQEIANDMGTWYLTVWRWLHKFEIELRSGSETCALLSRNTGPQNGMYGVTDKDSSNWKGGCTPERQALYSSREWIDSVSNVWKRDKAMCQRCGKHAGNKDGSNFCVHHKASFSDYPELRIDINNLALFCVDCHHWIHSKANVDKEFICES